MFFGADADAGPLGSSESPVGVSEGGKGRFRPADDGFSGVGSVVEVTVETVLVRGSFAFLGLFFFFFVVAVCPAVMVNRVLRHEAGWDA